MKKLVGKALVAQGGGSTAVINQSLVGVVLEALKTPEITQIYGSMHGVRGILEENFLDLSQATPHNLEQVASTPASSLGSTRDKPDFDYCQKMFQVMLAHNIRYFFYIGGNDSADTCRIISEQARAANYELRTIHVPKTIDNDLVLTDHCPGYGSAGKFVAQAIAGANFDIKSLPGIYIGVIMGRHTGFLTAASIFAKKFPDDGPHLIYVPERIFDMDQFLRDVERVYKKLGRCIIAVSEGIKDKNHEPIITSLTASAREVDHHGNVQLSGTGALGDKLGDLIRAKMKIKRVRSDTFGYIQRCFLNCISETDANEARAVGKKGVQFAVRDGVDGSISINRVGDYAVKYTLVQLSDVAGKTKLMPDNFIVPEGNMVTDAFKNYAAPLIGPLGTMDYLNAPPVPKIMTSSIDLVSNEKAN